MSLFKWSDDFVFPKPLKLHPCQGFEFNRIRDIEKRYLGLGLFTQRPGRDQNADPPLSTLPTRPSLCLAAPTDIFPCLAKALSSIRSPVCF
jgi:hypothetical protein